MAEFIELTDTRRGPIAINMDTVEVMAPITGAGTEIITITRHTRYLVKETMEDILSMMREETATTDDPEDFINQFVVNFAKETTSIMEVEKNEPKL